MPVKRLILLLALAVFFVAAGPARADTLHADTHSWSRAELRHAVHSLESRNANQARQIRALERSTGLILVTLPELVGYSQNGIRIGLIYVDSLAD